MRFRVPFNLRSGLGYDAAIGAIAQDFTAVETALRSIPKITVGPDEPADPEPGDIWIETT